MSAKPTKPLPAEAPVREGDFMTANPVVRRCRYIAGLAEQQGHCDADLTLNEAADEIERLEDALKLATHWRDFYRAQWLGPVAVPPVAPPDGETT